MDSAKPSMLRRVLAVLVLVLVAAVALRLAVGLVVGLVSAVLWILVVVAESGARRLSVRITPVGAWDRRRGPELALT